jgi:hypothetical protein
MEVVDAIVLGNQILQHLTVYSTQIILPNVTELGLDSFSGLP